jgi:maleate cis-trans isomerase
MAQRKDFRRIGLLLPSSSSAQEWDIGRALPDDVTLHVARMRLNNVPTRRCALSRKSKPRARNWPMSTLT